VALADLPPETIDAACKKYMQEGRFFPLPADIRAFCTKADAVVSAVDVEEAWQRALSYASKYGNLSGVKRPLLSEAAEVAIRACGGLDYLEACPSDQLQWHRKTFLEVYSRYKAAPSLALLPTTEEGRALLAAVSRVAETKQLRG
jgi:hypothetical protein